MEIVLTGGFRQRLPGHEVHHGGLAGGQPEGRQRHVAVQEPALVDQPRYLRLTHLQQVVIDLTSTYYQRDEGDRHQDQFPTFKCITYRLLFPFRRPVVEHELRDVSRTFARTE